MLGTPASLHKPSGIYTSSSHHHDSFGLYMSGLQPLTSFSTYDPSASLQHSLVYVRVLPLWCNQLLILAFFVAAQLPKSPKGNTIPRS